MLTWPKIVLLSLYAIGVLFTVAMVGKERKPITPGAATFTVGWTGAMAWLVILA